MPSQKATVLAMLRNAGERGVRSDAFYREFLGRGVARIYDLRQDGHEISSEKEGKYTRYTLARQDAGWCPLRSASVLSGQSRVGGRGEPVLSERAANATPDPAARLFELPSRSAFTDPEDVAA